MRQADVLVEVSTKLLAGHCFMALTGYPAPDDDRQRERALKALDYVTARRLSSDRRPAALRHLPRDREITSALKPLQRRLHDAQIAARFTVPMAWHRWLTDEDWQRRTIYYAATCLRPPRMANRRGYDLVRIWRRHVPTIHLAMVMHVATWPVRLKLSVAERYPELVPLLMPGDFADLATSDAWVLQALDMAERWRQALPLMCPDVPEFENLIRINARWLF